MAVCEAMVGLVLASVEGTIDAPGLERLTAHLAGCPGCRRAVAEQAAVKRALATMPMPRVSSDFAARVRAQVAPPSWLDAVNWRIWTLRLAPAAALLGLLAALPGASESASTQPQSLSGAMDTWTVTGTATGSSSANDALLLDPDTHPHALLGAALEETSR